MKSKLVLGLMFLSVSAFGSEDLKVKCSYVQNIDTSEIEQAVVSLAKLNSNSGYSSFVSQSVSITEGQQTGLRTLVCVTSKI